MENYQEKIFFHIVPKLQLGNDKKSRFKGWRYVCGGQLSYPAH
jgi:hypothetical protein